MKKMKFGETKNEKNMKNKWKINENKKMIEKQNEKMKLQMKTQMKNKWKNNFNISNLWLDANHINIYIYV